MPVTSTARQASRFALARATSGGGQNFLGARWVARAVTSSPERLRERMALRLLSLSPHYFYDGDVSAEAERNRRSRAALVDQLIAPYLTDQARVIDYGCGPGYLARAVAGRAAHVDAVDISAGVLACARAINGAPNICYLTPRELAERTEPADVAYSIAVAQHLRTPVLAGALALLAARLRPGGRLLLHFAVPGPSGWRTEGDWQADASLGARVKQRYGLHCFGRTAQEMSALAARAGFTDIEASPLAGRLQIPGDDDVSSQHLLVARRAAG